MKSLRQEQRRSRQRQRRLCVPGARVGSKALDGVAGLGERARPIRRRRRIEDDDNPGVTLRSRERCGGIGLGRLSVLGQRELRDVARGTVVAEYDLHLVVSALLTSTS